MSEFETVGHISRQPDRRDARTWHTTLTETGKDLSEYVEREFFNEMEAALGDPDERDPASLEHSMEIMIGVPIRPGMGGLEQRVGR